MVYNYFLIIVLFGVIMVLLLLLVFLVFWVLLALLVSPQGEARQGWAYVGGSWEA